MWGFRSSSWREPVELEEAVDVEMRVELLRGSGEMSQHAIGGSIREYPDEIDPSPRKLLVALVDSLNADCGTCTFCCPEGSYRF